MGRTSAGRFFASLLLMAATSCRLAAAVEGEPTAVTPPQETVVRAELAALNREFRDLETGLVPVDRGVVTILLRSPRHRITVYSHRLTLRTVSDAPAGTYDVWLTVELDGDGDLEATIEETGSVLTDRVVAPRQTIRVASRLRLVAADGGFHLEVVKPYLHTIDFQIESQLASRLVASCRNLSLFLGAFDCQAIEAALALARVPMPAVGERFWLPAENLGETDRTLLRSWAAAAGGD